MTEFLLGALILLVIAIFFTCKTSIEAFQDMKMRPWFGYEPGYYGPGGGRKGCSDDIPCTKV
jgi:hypothetical protein